MNILLVTPLYSQHYDAGHFWLRALNQLGHTVAVWDYRRDLNPPPIHPGFPLLLKGAGIDPRTLRRPRVCYWPDALERTPGIQDVLQAYDRVYTPVRPTPPGMTWLPTGWDPTIHGCTGVPRDIPSLYIGTNNSERKREFVDTIWPNTVAGNGWETPAVVIKLGHPRSDLPPHYLHDFVALASRARVAIDIHQGPAGLNRKLFELIPSAFTITDRAPGVEEVLGDIADQVSFTTPEQGQALLERWLINTNGREALWEKEKVRIAPYTYLNAARKMLDGWL